MKKTKQLLILIPFIVVAFIAFKPSDYTEIKQDKYTILLPDPMPLNDGLFWARKQRDTITITPYNSREYQLQIDMDSVQLWKGDKLIGKISLADSKLDSLIYKDNE